MLSVCRLRRFVALFACSLAVLSTSCDGFKQVASDAALADAADGGGVSDLSNDVSGGVFSFGMCCKDNAQCKSGLCASIAGGDLFCTEYCKQSPDSCPPGFVCGARSSICVPPDSVLSVCSADIHLARPKRVLGACCGKDGDCESNSCIRHGGGWRFCSRPCSASNDDCPVNYKCESSLASCVPDPPSGCFW